MESTIVAVSTPAGTGGIAVIRLSGPQAFEIADRVWKGAPLGKAASHTAHLGKIVDAKGEEVDEAVATVFHKGRSFTGEDTVEFSVHGSQWIQRETVLLLMAAGAAAAEPGEFTKRAFLNGRIDLSQAEGVADLIASTSRSAANLAVRQLKGDFSRKFDSLRDEMINMASMLELELDFSEEDVEFADRKGLIELCSGARKQIDSLASSFRTGKALKDGVAVLIAGMPNTGKSTLLNRLLQDDKAIVSDISGTTRDIIEDTIEIGGILFRFIDTAGLRETDNEIERIGIERARHRAAKADIILWMSDLTAPQAPQQEALEDLMTHLREPRAIIILDNKCDAEEVSGKGVNGIEGKSFSDQKENNEDEGRLGISAGNIERIRISAKENLGIEELTQKLTEIATQGHDLRRDLILTNARHYECLTKASESLTRTIEGLEAGQYTDLIAQDLRESIHNLSEITGTITTDDLLHSIFTRFCIGK